MSGFVATLVSALLALAAAAPPAATDATPAELFLQANRAYERGDYDAAAATYLRLLESGRDRGRLHYNLGNAHLRGGQLGRAIAAYRRALTSLPRDENVRANLSFARRSARDALAPPAPPALLETLFFWHYWWSHAALAWSVVVANGLLWLVLLARLLRPALPGTGATAAVLLTVVLATGGSLAAHRLLPSRVAVVVPQEVSAHAAPEADAVVRFKLHAGSELRVKAERDGWMRVALPDGQQGWIRSEWAEVVER